MPKLTRKQHYVPQFLQRNFSIGTDPNKVYIYENKHNTYIEPSIKLKSIEYNMQADYFYGESQIGENYLSEIESSASIEIASMIANPKKYMRKHKTLPESMHNFLSLSVFRGPNGIKKLYDAFCQSRIRQTDLELHETFGKVISFTDIPSQIKKFQTWNYKIIRSSSYAYLPDNILYGVLPLTPYIILLYGTKYDMEMLNHMISKYSMSYFIEYYNYSSILNMSAQVIVDEHTQITTIDRLYQKFQIKPTTM